MKVKIGPYLNWWGPYQIAELICFWAKEVEDEHGFKSHPDWVHDFGGWLADTWVGDFCQWVHDKRNRKIDIKIDRYDVWGMYSTLAYIIVPMLKELKEQAHGYPAAFAREDWYPSDQLFFEGDGFEFPEDPGFEKWIETIDEMIWAFEQVNEDYEDLYREGEADFIFVPCEDMPDHSTMEDGPNHTLVTDYDGIRKHEERMQKGFDLFAKYYKNLWD